MVPNNSTISFHITTAIQRPSNCKMHRSIGVNIRERKSGTERTKRRKKRELVLSPTARGRAWFTLHVFCPIYDNPGESQPRISLSRALRGPDQSDPSQPNRKNTHNFTNKYMARSNDDLVLRNTQFQYHACP